MELLENGRVSGELISAKPLSREPHEKLDVDSWVHHYMTSYDLRWLPFSHRIF